MQPRLRRGRRRICLWPWTPRACARWWGAPGAGSTWRRRARVPYGRQGQVGQHAGARGGAIEDDFVRALQDRLDGVDVEPPRRHVWRLGVGIVDRDEALGVALRLVHDLSLVGLRLLHDPGGFALSLGYHVVLVGVRLVLIPREVDLGALHVPEGVDHLRRRVDLLQLHLLNGDPRLVEIEDLLQQLLRIDLDLGAALDERARDLGVADHLAHGAFGRGLHGSVGITDVEQVFPGVIDDPEHREVDVDDVLVAGQHQGFPRHVLSGAATLADAKPDLDTVDARHLRPLDRLDGRGKVI